MFAVNIKSIAFRSNRSRRLFTFIPIQCGTHVDSVGIESKARLISMALHGLGYKTRHSMRNVVINLTLKRNLFSFLNTLGDFAGSAMASVLTAERNSLEIHEILWAFFTLST